MQGHQNQGVKTTSVHRAVLIKFKTIFRIRHTKRGHVTCSYSCKKVLWINDLGYTSRGVQLLDAIAQTSYLMLLPVSQNTSVIWSKRELYLNKATGNKMVTLSTQSLYSKHLLITRINILLKVTSFIDHRLYLSNPFCAWKTDYLQVEKLNLWRPSRLTHSRFAMRAAGQTTSCEKMVWWYTKHP